MSSPDSAACAACAAWPRLPQSSVLHHERYDHSGEAAAVQAYDLRMSDFQRSQVRDDTAWSRVSVERVKGPESLMGRDRLQGR